MLERRRITVAGAVGLVGLLTSVVATVTAPAVAASTGVVLPVGATPVDASADGGIVLVAFPELGTTHLGVVDVGAGTVRDLTAEGLAPNNSGVAALSDDGRYVLDSTRRIDTVTGTTIALTTGGALFADVLSADGRYAIVVDAGGSASRFDFSTGGATPLPAFTTTGVGALSPNGRHAVVFGCAVGTPCDLSDGGSIDARVVDIDTANVIASYPTFFEQGFTPETAVADDGRYVERANDPDLTATVVDPRRGTRTTLRGTPRQFDRTLSTATHPALDELLVVRVRDDARWSAGALTAGERLLTPDGSAVVTVVHATDQSTLTLVRGAFAARRKGVPAGTITRLTRPGSIIAQSTYDVNVTVTEPSAPGYLRVFDCAGPMPDTSNVNFAADETVANHAIVTAAGGEICAYANQDTEVVLDVGGRPQGYAAVPPTRLLDTREPGQRPAATQPGTSVSLPVAGVGSVPATARAVVLNVTATDGVDPGFVTAWPCGTPLPLVSSANFERGQTRAALVTVAPGIDGRVCLYSNVTVDLVVDVQGAFLDGAPVAMTTPTRLLDTRTGPAADPVPAESVTRLHIVDPPAGDPSFTVAFLNVTATDAADAGFLSVYQCAARNQVSVVNVAPGAIRSNSAAAPLDEHGDVCIFNHMTTHLVVDLSGTATDPPDVVGDGYWAFATRGADTRAW